MMDRAMILKLMTTNVGWDWAIFLNRLMMIQAQ